MFGVKQSFDFDLKQGACVRLVFHDLYNIRSQFLCVGFKSKLMAKTDKHLDGVVTSVKSSGKEFVFHAVCDIGSTYVVVDIEDINNGKLEILELTPNH